MDEDRIAGCVEHLAVVPFAVPQRLGGAQPLHRRRDLARNRRENPFVVLRERVRPAALDVEHADHALLHSQRNADLRSHRGVVDDVIGLLRGVRDPPGDAGGRDRSGNALTESHFPELLSGEIGVKARGVLERLVRLIHKHDPAALGEERAPNRECRPCEELFLVDRFDRDLRDRAQQDQLPKPPLDFFPCAPPLRHFGLQNGVGGIEFLGPVPDLAFKVVVRGPQLTVKHGALAQSQEVAGREQDRHADDEHRADDRHIRVVAGNEHGDRETHAAVGEVERGPRRRRSDRHGRDRSGPVRSRQRPGGRKPRQEVARGPTRPEHPVVRLVEKEDRAPPQNVGHDQGGSGAREQAEDGPHPRVMASEQEFEQRPEHYQIADRKNDREEDPELIEPGPANDRRQQQCPPHEAGRRDDDPGVEQELEAFLGRQGSRREPKCGAEKQDVEDDVRGAAHVRNQPLVQVETEHGGWKLAGRVAQVRGRQQPPCAVAARSGRSEAPGRPYHDKPDQEGDRRLESPVDRIEERAVLQHELCRNARYQETGRDRNGDRPEPGRGRVPVPSGPSAVRARLRHRVHPPISQFSSFAPWALAVPASLRWGPTRDAWAPSHSVYDGVQGRPWARGRISRFRWSGVARSPAAASE